MYESFAYPIPQIFPDDTAAPLLCGGIIGYRSLRLSNIKPGERLGLFGFGASAHIAIQVARHWGCEVYVFSRNEHHRKLAAEITVQTEVEIFPLAEANRALQLLKENKIQGAGVLKIR